MDYKKYYPALVIVSAVVIVLLLVWAMFAPHKDNVELASKLDLNPSPIASVTSAFEPAILSWRDYTNNDYNFTLSVPEDWYEQKFTSPNSKEGLLVAFSPEQLPCETCSYVYSGYFSIKVYNQKTDPERYTNFLQRMQAAGTGRSREYQLIMLDGIKGVASGNSVAAENHEWVYELSLDKDQGNAQIMDSQVFKKVLSSFKFTYLLFTK